MDAEPATLPITDPCRGCPIVLARLTSVDPAWLRKMLEAHRLKIVPKTLSKTYARVA